MEAISIETFSPFFLHSVWFKPCITALQEKESSHLLQQLILDPDTETIQDKIALVQAVINGLNDHL